MNTIFKIVLSLVFFVYHFSGIVGKLSKRLWVWGSWWDRSALIGLFVVIFFNDRGDERSESAQDIHGYQCVNDYEMSSKSGWFAD